VPYLRDLLAPASFVEGSTSFRPDYSYYSEAVCGEGFCCIGDAANFVDPIFSQGVVAALYDAALCQWMIASTFRNPRNRESYRKICEDLIKQYYGFARLLALGHFGGDGVDPGLVRRLIRSLPRNELELALASSGAVHRAQNLYRMARETGQLEGLEELLVDRSERISAAELAAGCTAAGS
jgi:2-polyprenyl-6-methoxyphenol hydroxylase-like FAD-dependent oxidoreductase